MGGWNKPKAGQTEMPVRKPQVTRWVLPGLVGVAVVGIVIAILFLSGGERSDEESERSSRRIKEVRLALVSQTNSVQVSAERSVAPVRKKPREGNTGYSKIDYGPIETNRIDKSRLPLAERIFDHPVDRKIAGLLMVEPGTEIFGEVDGLYRDFNRKFLKSIQTPIIITKDDSEEAAELKRAVRETKIDLKARLDAGEDLEKVMSDTWKQLQELGLYREELRKEINKVAHDRSLSKEDMEDYVTAANKMLESRGSKPISMPEFFTHRLELQKARLKKQGLPVEEGGK